MLLASSARNDKNKFCASGINVLLLHYTQLLQQRETVESEWGIFRRSEEWTLGNCFQTASAGSSPVGHKEIFKFDSGILATAVTTLTSYICMYVYTYIHTLQLATLEDRRPDSAISPDFPAASLPTFLHKACLDKVWLIWRCRSISRKWKWNSVNKIRSYNH